MARLTWNQSGSRLFEAGVSNGVLYPLDSKGVVWNGLTSVKESSSGGTPSPYYVDGIKYLNVPSREEFGGTLEAYTYPDEFEPCNGLYYRLSGFGIDQQARQTFGLSYQTRVGNDVNGVDYGFKIHIYYNLLASPAEKTYNTISETVDPSTFSWQLTSKPIILDSYRPSSHFVLDSKRVDSTLLNSVMNILYGTSTKNPRLPTPFEIISLLEAGVTLYPSDDVNPDISLNPR